MTEIDQLVRELVRAHHDVVNAEVALEREYTEFSSNATPRNRAEAAQQRFNVAIDGIKQALAEKDMSTHA